MRMSLPLGPADKDNARGDVFRLNFVMRYELVALQQDIVKILSF